MNKLTQLIATGKTVFSTMELGNIWTTDRNTVKSTAYRMVKNGDLVKIRRGFFTFGKKTNPFELGCKLVPKSYVSLFTVLKKEAVIFQEYASIFLVAPRPKVIKVLPYRFEYHTIRRLVSVPDGIEFTEYYSLASLERALLETFCLFDTDFTDFKITRFDKEKFLKLSALFNKKTRRKASEFLTFFSL